MALIMEFMLWLIMMVMVASTCNKVDYICHRLNEISKKLDNIANKIEKEGR